MLLHLFHDKSALAEISGLRSAIEEFYGPYGLRAQDCGYLFVPSQDSRLNAAMLLKYMVQIASMSISANTRAMTGAALWLVDGELYYPEIGAVFGCSAGRVALLSSAGMDSSILAKEALHEVGHLMGLDHCKKGCIMQLSETKMEAEEKLPTLCPDCSAMLKGSMKAGLTDNSKASPDQSITLQSQRCSWP